MFDFLKKKKKEKKEKETKKETIKETPQDTRSPLARGMYCTSCGYMTVNEESNALPLEGFAICPNCGDFLKISWFMKVNGGYALAENASSIAHVKSNKASGGHYRVRKPGPNRSRKKGNLNRH